MAPRTPRLLWTVLAVGAVAGGSIAAVGPASATTSTQGGAAAVLTLLNQDRAAAGLRALRVDLRLGVLATNRASEMAATGDLSHTSYGGQIESAVAGTGVAAYSTGEVVGMTTAATGPAAAAYIYGLWKASPVHWALMTSAAYNYLGIGTAVSTSTGGTFASIVFAEAPDITPPVVSMTRAAVKGTTASFSWTGSDRLLQTHTSGLRNFDVEYRVDGGTWKMLREQTTTTSIVLAGRPRGHAYSIRVRDRDRRDNMSAWSSARSVRVP